MEEREKTQSFRRPGLQRQEAQDIGMMMTELQRGLFKEREKT